MEAELKTGYDALGSTKLDEQIKKAVSMQEKKQQYSHSPDLNKYFANVDIRQMKEELKKRYELEREIASASATMGSEKLAEAVKRAQGEKVESFSFNDDVEKIEIPNDGPTYYRTVYHLIHFTI